MLTRFGFASICSFLWVVSAFGGSYAYVTGNFASPTILIIDGETNTIAGSIPVSPDLIPRGAATSPDGKRLYVTTGQEIGFLLIIDIDENSPTFHTIIGEVALPPFSDNPVVTPDGRRVYATNSASSIVLVVDTLTEVLPIF